MFGILQKFNISIKSFKTFLAYFSVRLLEQKMNFLKLTTNKDKLRAISKFRFLNILRQLKHYLDLTDYMREYVRNYAKKTKLLQNKKIAMLKRSSFIKGSARRSFSARTTLQDSTQEEIQFFKILQKRLSFSRYLVHFNSVRQLYMDVDSNKKENIRIMIYHFKQKQNINYPARSFIEPIMFLSRRITDVEIKYWSIELELIDLM